MVLDRNVTNYFAEVEQSSFSPAHMPPGIEASADRMLQSRLFAYDDAARYRIGGNYLQVPVNRCPFAKVQTYARDGVMVTTDKVVEASQITTPTPSTTCLSQIQTSQMSILTSTRED
ncbi:unnamed protein product [Calypogeia fissa]